MPAFRLAIFLIASILVCVTGLSQGAQDEDPVQRDGRAMHEAIDRGDVNEINILIKRGYINPDGYTGLNGQNYFFLYWAFNDNKWESVRALLEGGARQTGDDAYFGPLCIDQATRTVSQEFTRGETASAQYQPMLDHLQLLIDYKIIDLAHQRYTYIGHVCNVREPFAFQTVPLNRVAGLIGHMTFSDDQIKLVRALAQVHFDWAAKDNNDVNVAFWMATPEYSQGLRGEDFSRLFSTLKDLGVDINATDANGYHPIDFVRLNYGTPFQKCAAVDGIYANEPRLQAAEKRLMSLGSVPPRPPPTQKCSFGSYCIKC